MKAPGRHDKSRLWRGSCRLRLHHQRGCAKLIDSLNVDLRKAVQVIVKYENGVKVKWYTIEMVFPGNQIARVAFRQLEDGTWTIKML